MSQSSKHISKQLLNLNWRSSQHWHIWSSGFCKIIRSIHRSHTWTCHRSRTFSSSWTQYRIDPWRQISVLQPVFTVRQACTKQQQREGMGGGIDLVNGPNIIFDNVFMWWWRKLRLTGGCGWSCLPAHCSVMLGNKRAPIMSNGARRKRMRLRWSRDSCFHFYRRIVRRGHRGQKEKKIHIALYFNRTRQFQQGTTRIQLKGHSFLALVLKWNLEETWDQTVNISSL